MLTVWLLLLALSYGVELLLAVAPVASITEEPQSVTVVVGGKATFQCAGIGDYVLWNINGEIYQEADQTEFVVTRETVSGIRHCNLTVPTTSAENNGTTVQCILTIFSPSSTDRSDNATLIVLPGIGNIRNLNFNDETSSILWDPPQTAGVVGNLFYQLVMINKNTGQVIVNTTTTLTSYGLPFEPCQVYVGKVTAHVGNIAGETVVQEHSTPTKYYNLLVETEDTEVASYNDTHCAVTFLVTLLKQSLVVTVCPGQELTSVTYPLANSSDKTQQPRKVITQPGMMKYTVYVKKDFHCASDIKIIADNREIEMRNATFSTFAVQHCAVHTDHTSYIFAECTFAINSTAPGFVLIQDAMHKGKPLERLVHGNCKGSANITDLPTGEYRVTVYDEMEDYFNNISPAYIHQTLLQIVLPINSYYTLTESLHSTLNSEVVITLSVDSPVSTIIQTPVVQFKNVNIVVILVSSVATGLLLLLCTVIFIVILICATIRMKRRNKKGADVTDHIPVDDNPVYITLKKIDLKRNMAYETITITGKPQY